MSLPHVLLGLLTRGSASGWDFRARMLRDPSIGWDADLAQIYPTLRRLLRGGFISKKRRRSTKGPSRSEYRLTAAGRKEFRNWLAEPPALPRAKDPMLARLAFLERLSLVERRDRLDAYRALLVTSFRKLPPASSAARRRRRTLLEAEIAWADTEGRVIATRLSEAE